MNVSIVIPVFNVAPYLRACLDSVLSQKAREFELICVDDGSTDESGAILDEYAARDDRIRVVHKSNGGLSSARNAGIEASRGETLLFLDSDDVVSPDWAGCLVQGMEGVDLAWGGYDADEGGCVVSHLPRDAGIVYAGEAARLRVWRAVFGYRLRDLVLSLGRGGLWQRCQREFGSVCWRAFRRSVMGDLRFDEKVGLYEDAVFLSEYARRIGSVRVVGNTGYHYFIRPGGMLTVEARERMIRHRFELRDARRRIDPMMSHWRGSFLLSAVDVFRRAGFGAFVRYVTFKPFV